MAIIARQPESNYEPAPEGLYQAVCVDVIDLGQQTSQYGTQHKVELRWQLEDTNEKGYRFELRKRYTLSLHEKAALRKDLQSWRGRKFTDEELAGFDLEKLLGVNAQLQVIHNIVDDGRIFANIQAIVPVPPKVAKLTPKDYVRQQDRDHKAVSPVPGPDFEEEPVPF